MGATLLSVRTIEKTDTMTIIPSKYGGIFSSMLAQMVASITQGIAVVSLYLASEPDAPMMKTLIDEVRKLLAESAS